MFTQPRSTYAGRRHSIDDALNVPQPVQAGGPGIMIGGNGERKTLRLTARYADMWNGFGDPATIRHKLDVLEAHCREVGRDPSEIVSTRLARSRSARRTRRQTGGRPRSRSRAA
jgi:alkanesulfonate monooxygenase SsuD/methylene tetrahydromethanopterin reductase-like flavin-dependent oxidoreductase (luciferase family)